ncbi:hypothetical protein F441_02551 [Phytophthora nicotianae CJ01A1]|uniref:Uncharacterized protein n=4 Tax=Phytophthora nicotianae TaxID=4792 RepID=W2QRY9_PHYN3|nr:hypothetical protein PPTG_22102 [Phytophthora nicotianae INRA-310]ETK94476.1 hypothetical protein L915_02482 [Phytophthora nicotianae]ETO83391.1 hypothetical protein F444_02597 [Phytophthora nicotianae P1976]ETP24473.1 hypothetical protein F441_02551 [Phytophthora nicotianae CJ01A1]ETL47850.1 hypothetical protein L916_02454 [Phytophthora nicotianae]ETM00962.1 hypothetical protein L917_02382 [Phytophthora nicotianae]
MITALYVGFRVQQLQRQAPRNGSPSESRHGGMADQDAGSAILKVHLLSTYVYLEILDGVNVHVTVSDRGNSTGYTGHNEADSRSVLKRCRIIPSQFSEERLGFVLDKLAQSD